jgi:hypothetical protein
VRFHGFGAGGSEFTIILRTHIKNKIGLTAASVFSNAVLESIFCSSGGHAERKHSTAFEVGRERSKAKWCDFFQIQLYQQYQYIPRRPQNLVSEKRAPLPSSRVPICTPSHITVQPSEAELSTTHRSILPARHNARLIHPFVPAVAADEHQVQRSALRRLLCL